VYLSPTVSTGSGNTTTLATVLAPSQTIATLRDLFPYTSYSISILAFNAAGNGPNLTTPLVMTTNEDVPGPPGALQFVVSSPTSLSVSWTAPARPNGVVQMYEVSYTQDVLVDGVSKYVAVQLSPNVTSYATRQLIENMRYFFTLRCRTKVDWGPAVSGNVTVAPLPGSPGAPGKPVCIVCDKSVLLSWVAGSEGGTPIQGYIVQMKLRVEGAWTTQQTTATPDTTADVSIIAIQPIVDYQVGRKTFDLQYIIFN